MTEMEHQDILLVERTMENLAFIEQRAVERGRSPWEVTQAVNSFLSVFAYPKERLLDPSKIKWITLDDEIVKDSGLPRLSSSWVYDREQPRTLGHLLRLLRNGVAHGNLDLLTKREVWARRRSAQFDEGFPEDDIAGIEIWNEDNSGRTWGTVLTIEEMGQALRAVSRLSLNPSLHLQHLKPKTGGRKERPQGVKARSSSIGIDRGVEARLQEDAQFDPAESHPLGEKDVVRLVIERTGALKFSTYDVRTIGRLWNVESHPELFFRSTFPNSRPQYSHQFLEDVVDRIEQEPNFLKKSRLERRLGELNTLSDR